MQVKVVVIVPSQRDLDVARRTALTLESLFNVNLVFFVLGGGHDDAASDVLFGDHGCMLFKRRLVGFHPLRASLELR